MQRIPEPAPIEPVLLSVAAVGKMLSLSKSLIYKLMKEDERFPVPVNMPCASTRFLRSDIDEYVNSLKQGVSA